MTSAGLDGVWLLRLLDKLPAIYDTSMSVRCCFGGHSLPFASTSAWMPRQIFPLHAAKPYLLQCEASSDALSDPDVYYELAGFPETTLAMRYRRVMLGLMLLSTSILVYRVAQLESSSGARKTRALAATAREHAIRAYYRKREPDWRNRPPGLVQRSSRSAGQPHNLSLALEQWYGSSREAGPSPYEFVPRPLRADERKTRVLFLLEFRDYLERMNSHSYEMFVAARHAKKLEYG